MENEQLCKVAGVSGTELGEVQERLPAEGRVAVGDGKAVVAGGIGQQGGTSAVLPAEGWERTGAPVQGTSAARQLEILKMEKSFERRQI